MLLFKKTKKKMKLLHKYFIPLAKIFNDFVNINHHVAVYIQFLTHFKYYYKITQLWED